MARRDNIGSVSEAGLCVGCGVCKALCPAHCIEYSRSEGMYLPVVDVGKCLNCGICLKICPGCGCDYAEMYREEGQELPDDLFAGHCIEAFAAVARDAELQRKATSGGVVTALVRHLLRKGMFDCAFLVDGHKYDVAAATMRKVAGDDLLGTCKSRYVPVQQTAAVEYMLENRNERLIFVGVPCFVQSLLRTMRHANIDRGRHLIIGLFCAASMNYNACNYLEYELCADGDTAESLYFRDKSSGGNGRLCSCWPGDVCAIGKNGRKYMARNSLRMDAKTFFEPERCLYCIDKLNQFADISVGDNYTGRNADRMGSSSVIVRTKRGMLAKDEALFRIFPDEFEAVCKAQKLICKTDNLCYQRFCGSSVLHCNNELPMPSDWEARRGAYEAAKAALSLGAKADFAAIRQAIAKKTAEKKRRKSLWHKFLRLLGFEK